jgi:hypothetical protein
MEERSSSNSGTVMFNFTLDRDDVKSQSLGAAR